MTRTRVPVTKPAAPHSSLPAQWHAQIDHHSVPARHDQPHVHCTVFARKAEYVAAHEKYGLNRPHSLCSGTEHPTGGHALLSLVLKPPPQPDSHSGSHHDRSLSNAVGLFLPKNRN